MHRTRSIVIHAHFYQPPRENPWLEEVDTELSAAPFHDWNQRIEQECYRAVVSARLLSADGRIDRIVNTLCSVSFNFGPTLLEWMEREAPATYAAVLEADRVSQERHEGHGNAIAQPYHHAILPLSSRRDKTTEVRWGIADFRRRFGREPEGMWLPETAVDEETLDVLAAEGIQFTILAPHQVVKPPPAGLPGLYRTANGRTIALFIYDGPLSHAIAFGSLLNNAHAWAEQMVAGSDKHHKPHLVAAATDGETYGHHHRFGEMALARVLDELEHRRGVKLENFPSFLMRNPATDEVKLVAPSAWSCTHGVERWRSDCGCRIAPDRKTHQRWRAPLRAAIDGLASDLHALFEREGARYFADPWAARDAYGTVVGADAAALERFTGQWIRASAEPEEQIRARELLEMERDALRMFTSCAWFFDDIGGLEPLQVLRYAARAIELAGSDGVQMEQAFVARLAEAVSNDEGVGTGRDVFLRRAKPRVPPVLRVAGGYAAARQLAPDSPVAPPLCCQLEESGSRIVVTQRRTGYRSAFDVSVESAAAKDVTVLVRQASGGALTTYLGLADLPERHRSVIVAALRRDLIRRVLSDAEREQVANGDVSVQQVTLRALAGAVRALADDQAPATIQRVSDLLDLLERTGGGVPYDVQTDFQHIRTTLPLEQAQLLAPIAWRLGFAEAATEAGHATTSAAQTSSA